MKKLLSFFTVMALLFSQITVSTQNAFASSTSDILITEVYYDVKSGYSENEGEWFELYNPTATPVNLSGWTISDLKNSGGTMILGNTYTFTGGVDIASGDFLLVGNDATEFTALYPGEYLDIDMEKTDAPDCKTNNECLQLNNGGGDALTLKDDSGNIIDHMGWEGIDGFSVNADEDFSACRRNLIDTDTDTEWANNCEPTPGTGTFVTQFPGGVPIASLLWSKIDSETYNHGDTITTLNDRSGNDRNGTNSGTPSFDTTNIINYYPTASFDGISDGFTFPEYTFPTGDKNYTMYSVFTSPLTQDNMTLQYVGRDSGTNNSTITYINSDGSTYDDFDNGVANLNGTPSSSVVVNTPTIVSFNYNSLIDTKKTYINGEEVSTLTGLVDHNASNTATSDRGIGFNADSSSNYFLGNIAEVLSYDSELDSTSKQKIDSYLALKYGITLDQTVVSDYINSSGSVLWNSTLNAEYTNNIAGIGQNNLSDLDQKISHSINLGSILTLSTSNDFISLNTDVSRISLVDGKFVVVGSNTGSVLTQTGELDNSLYTSRVTREWKIQNSGDVGTVFMKFDGFDENVVLLTDSDGDFSTGATNNGALNTDGSISITLSDGEYFTLATLVTNNPPTDITLSGSTLDENNGVGESIGELISLDRDTLDTHIYTLVSGTGDTDNTSFTLSGTTLFAGSSFDYESQNSYSIRVQTDDRNGGIFQKIFTITITDIDEVSPVITLVGSGTVEVLLNATYAELGATWTDNVDGSGSILTASSGNVDTAVIGQYLLDYTYTDTHSNSGNTVTRTVNVVSGDTPVITLNGSGSITQEVGNFYFDAGAEYVDTEDGTNPIVGSGSFDVFTVGIYVLTYDYTDTHGNIATQVTRTVHIEDTTEPVVVLNGSTSESVFLDSTFIDVGAQWTDNYDGTGSIVSANSGSVDTSILGQYLLDYTYIDTHSNSGNTVTRTVNVVSGDTPIITINGNGTITQEVGSGYIDLGAEYSDTEDGTGALIASGTVDGYTVGEYILTYDFDDSQGNSAIQVIRTVNIVDTINPLVILNGDNPSIVLLNEIYADQGATWEDNYDGTGDIWSGTGNVDPGTVGAYTLDYTYEDVSGNSHTVTRTINVVSGNVPIITLNGSGEIDHEFSRETSGFYDDVGAVFSDIEDGTGAVYGNGIIDDYTLGTYVLTYDYTDYNGNPAAQVTRTVNIVDTTDPVIVLNGNSSETVYVGEDFVDQGADWTDNVDYNGYIFSASSGSVDTSTVGVYVLEYTYTDSSGNSSSETRTVNVISGDTPVISLIGNETITQELGSLFVDEGAEYSDTEDGTGTLVGSGGVDIYTVGAYILTYDYTDTSGNSATQVTRTVIIEDTTPATASQNSGGGGGYSKRKTDGNLSSSNDVITGQEEFDEGELENIVEDNVEDAPTLDIDVSEENLGEKLKEVDGDMKRYSLHSEYNSCSIIDNLLDENYTNNFETELVDISKSEQKVLIERLEKAGVASGTIEGKFEGDRDISRVEFLKFVLRSHCIEYRNEDASNLEFRDLNNTTWQAKVIKKSLDLGIANGDLDLDGNKIFRADDVISSIEATKILLRMALVQQGTEPITQYKDLEVEWHKNYVQQGEYLGVFNAEEDNYRFSPDDGINRNNTVEFLYKVIRLYR